MTRDLSRSVDAQQRCVSGHSWTETRWETIDVAGRPDLAALLARGELLRRRCPVCGDASPRREPLLVLTSAIGLDLALVFTSDGGAPPGLPGADHDLVAALGTAPLVLNLPFEAAGVVLGRSTDSDLEDPETAVAQVVANHSAETAAKYMTFLGMVMLAPHRDHFGGLFDRLMESLGTRSPDAVMTLVSDEAGLLDDGFIAYLSAMGSTGLFGDLVPRVIDTLQRARTDPEGAIAALFEWMESATTRGESLADPVREISLLLGQCRWDDAIAVIDLVLPQAEAAGLGILATRLHANAGQAHLNSRQGDRDIHVEVGIAHLEAARNGDSTAEERALAASNLAAAWGQRLRGDPAENLARTLAVLEDALASLGPHISDARLAYLHHNTARALQLSEHGDHVENLRDAQGHCLASLRLRSPSVDGARWAESMLVFADILAELANGDGTLATDAEQAFRDVLEAADKLDDQELLVRAHDGLAALALAEVQAIPDGNGLKRREAVARANAHARDAREALDNTCSASLVGRTLALNAEIFAAAGTPTDAIAAGQQALTILTPTSDPRACRRTSVLVGALLAQDGKWAAAADAYRAGVQASMFAFHTRLDAVKRQEEIRIAGDLHRCAAYAFAMVGASRLAARTLEEGRAHELRRRSTHTVSDERLAGLPRPLAVAYREATALLSAAPIGDASREPSRDLQSVLAEIRLLPGYEDFDAATTFRRIVEAAEPDSPLVYVNPTPFGTLLLCVDSGADEPRARCLPTVTSSEVDDRIRLGDRADPSPASYLKNVTAQDVATDGRPVDRLADSLRQLLPWLGETIARPIDDLLAASHATGATLIPAGALALTPLHAAAWMEHSGPVCLLDRVDVRFAPSADSHSECRRRASSPAPVFSLVAIGDPAVLPRLPAARAEVAEIAKCFAPHASVEIDVEATSRFLLSEAPGATHVHLACHGTGSTEDFNDACIHLTDRQISASELSTAGVLNARLTVASACQTGVSQQAQAPEEGLSLGTALVAAGSACVIASLWSVDDVATAMLMTRLYELLTTPDPPVPYSALRSAQLWLRELTLDQARAYLGGHPELAKEARRGLCEGHRGTSRGSLNGSYSSAELWAAFICFGA